MTKHPPYASATQAPAHTAIKDATPAPRLAAPLWSLSGLESSSDEDESSLSDESSALDVLVAVREGVVKVGELVRVAAAEPELKALVAEENTLLSSEKMSERDSVAEEGSPVAEAEMAVRVRPLTLGQDCSKAG